MHVAPLRPYFGLRSYQDGGKHYDGQIGSEATPAEFLDALLAATREMVRVLKPTGSIFVNLGDKYAGSRMDGSSDNGTGSTGLVGTASIRDREAARGQGVKRQTSIPTKSLMGIPWRYAIRCIDDLGLILRAEIIWNKPNGLPESVTDRVRRSHEQWFHFVKQPRYFAAVDEIREAHSPVSEQIARNARKSKEQGHLYTTKHAIGANTSIQGGHSEGYRDINSLGKLPGSVWSVPTQPLTVPPELGVDHFAAYPMEWPRRIIQGWTPNGVCTVCGQGRRPVSQKELIPQRFNLKTGNKTSRNAGNNHDWAKYDVVSGTNEIIITGYMCGCADATAPTTPSVILDPFGGTGTTALVAKALGRTGISVDLSHDYCRMAVWRTNDPAELAAALQVEKPEPVPDGQVALF